MISPQIWNSFPEKMKSGTNLVDFKNLIKKGSALNASPTYILLKTKMQKIGHGNLSLHAPLINSFLSNFGSI